MLQVTDEDDKCEFCNQPIKLGETITLTISGTTTEEIDSHSKALYVDPAKCTIETSHSVCKRVSKKVASYFNEQ